MFNKTDYAILTHIYYNHYDSALQSITTQELIQASELSSTKVRATISNFIRVGYVAEGLKDGNNKTYYITQEGIKHFESMFGSNDRSQDKDNKEE